MSAPRVPIAPRFETIAEGLRGAGARPFVVPGAGRREFAGADDPERILAALSGHARPLFGYGAGGALVETTADVALAEWRRGELSLNLIDAPLPELRAVLQASTLELLGDAPVAPVLTRAGSYTPLHVDPPGHGGGWMFLATGDKDWLFVDPEHIAPLYDRDRGRLRDLPIEELVATVPPGATCRAALAAGGFLFFPPAWLHRVRTSSDCVGVGGYFMRDEDRAPAARHGADLGPGGRYSFWL